MMDEDMLAETQKALQDALAQGTDFATFKARLKPYLMARGWWGKQLMGDPQDGEIKLVQLGSTRRLRTIYHTNLHSAYAAGQWARIERNKKAFPYLKYIPSDAAFPREEHRRFYGMILPVDDPFWQTHMPPNGWGCRCNVRVAPHAGARIETAAPASPLRNEPVAPHAGARIETRGQRPHKSINGSLPRAGARITTTWSCSPAVAQTRRSPCGDKHLSPPRFIQHKKQNCHE